MSLVETAFDERKTPEIWETGEEKALSIGQLKYKFLQYAKHNFQGKIFTNRGTEKPIRVSADGIMEWWWKSRRREHIIAVQALEFFLVNGIFTLESSDYHGRKKIESASKFENECNVNGKHYHVVITTRKAMYDTNKFRYFSLKKIGLFKNKKAAVGKHDPMDRPRVYGLRLPPTLTIVQTISLVKYIFTPRNTRQAFVSPFGAVPGAFSSPLSAA